MSASLRHLPRRLLPIAVALGALFYAIHGADLSKVQVALQRAPLGVLLLVSAAMALLNCGADTLAMYHVFRGFGLRLKFVDLYTIRAATYTLAVINYHAGQLGIIGFLHRTSKVPLSRASAYILFIVGIWVGLLMIFASGGALFGGPKGQAMLPVLGLFAIGVGIYWAMLRWPPRILLSPPPLHVPGSPPLPLSARLWRRALRIVGKLWEPLHEVGVAGHLRALVVRLPHLAVLLIWHFIALRCFRIEVPFHVAMLYLPVVFAVAALPISVQGLGTAQVVARYYFSEFAVPGAGGGDEAVLAYSLSMTAISTASNLLMGLLFLRRATRLGLAEATEQAARIEAQEQAAEQAVDDSESADPSGSGPAGSAPPAAAGSESSQGSKGGASSTGAGTLSQHLGEGESLAPEPQRLATF